MVQLNTILLPVVSWWDVPVFGTPVTFDCFPPDLPEHDQPCHLFSTTSSEAYSGWHLGTNKQNRQDRETGLPRAYPPSQLLISLAHLSSLRRDAFFAHSHPPTPFGAPPKNRPPPHLCFHHSRGHQLRTHGLLTQIPLIDILSSLHQTFAVALGLFRSHFPHLSFRDSCRAALLLLDLDDTTIILLDTLTQKSITITARRSSQLAEETHRGFGPSFSTTRNYEGSFPAAPDTITCPHPGSVVTRRV